MQVLMTSDFIQISDDVIRFFGRKTTMNFYWYSKQNFLEGLSFLEYTNPKILLFWPRQRPFP